MINMDTKASTKEFRANKTLTHARLGVPTMGEKTEVWARCSAEFRHFNFIAFANNTTDSPVLDC